MIYAYTSQEEEMYYVAFKNRCRIRLYISCTRRGIGLPSKERELLSLLIKLKSAMNIFYMFWLLLVFIGHSC
jgi:hypothetical protein